MLLNIKSWNGTNLNDSNFGAFFPHGQPMGAMARPSFSARSRTFAFPSSKEIQGVTLSFHVLCYGTFHDQFETLKAMFPVEGDEGFAFGTLVVQDQANSNKEWYVKGYAISPPVVVGAGEYVITLALYEPLWRSVAVASANLDVLTSGDDVSLSVGGNYPAKPIITLTIGGARAGGFAYRWWLPRYNPLTTRESAEPLLLTSSWNTASLINDTSKSNQINQSGGISNTTLSIPIDTPVGGGLNTAGGMCYVGTEQIYYTSINAGVMTVYDNGAGTTGRGWGGTTATSHADNAVMAQSQMMANGQDLRVQVNRAIVDMWFDGINTSNTKVWINRKFAPLVSLTLLATGSGSITTLNFEKVAANATALKKLPSIFPLFVGNEAFLCHMPNAATHSCVVIERGYRGTTPTTHAAKAVARYIEHDIYLMWGNPTVDAQVVDNSRKPMLNLNTSTNTSWDWDEFSDELGLRSAGWIDSLIKSAGLTSPTPTYLYTESEGGFAEPAEVMGIAARSFVVNNAPKAESFTAQWMMYHPAGFTHITASGKKRRLTANWPTFALYKSANGSTLTAIYTEATPASAGSFVALSSHSNIALGTGSWLYLIFRGTGSLGAILNNEADKEISDFTGTITSANVIQNAFATTPENSYYLDAVIGITETGETIRLRGTCKVGSVIVIDCDAETLTVDGNESGVDIDWNSIRLGWLDLPSPKQSSTCTLYYIEEGVADVEMDVEHEDRNTL